MSQARSIVLWGLKYAAGGVVSYATPRLLVAMGVPLDTKIVAIAGWLSFHVSTEAALWAATVFAGLILYAGSAIFSQGYGSDPQISNVFRRLWKKMNPCYLIVVGLGTITLGLALTITGFVWQRKPVSQLQSEAPPLPQSIQPSAAHLERSIQAPTKPNSTRVVYTERDIRELLDGLTDAQRLVEKTISPAFFGLETLVVNWQGIIPNQGVEGFARLLSEAREKIQTDVWPKVNDFVYTSHSRYVNEMRFALALDEEAARGEVVRALDVAIAAVKLLPANVSPETSRLVEPQLKEVHRHIQPPVYKWIGTARSRIEEMTKNLRAKGVTGFEKD